MSLGRIVGGQDASSMIPWQVSVRQGTSGNGHYCGATILDSKTILSAAHCFDKGQSMSGQYIMAGSTNRHSGGQVIKTISEVNIASFDTLGVRIIPNEHYWQVTCFNNYISYETLLKSNLFLDNGPICTPTISKEVLSSSY